VSESKLLITFKIKYIEVSNSIKRKSYANILRIFDNYKNSFI